MRAKRTSSALPPTSGEQGLSPAERSLRTRLAAHSMHASAPTSVGGEKRLFYTLKEAAALLHISPETYYRGVREGRFPGRKVGGQWRVPCGALHRYAEGEAAAS
jgi:excisionase family DNA binding protein